MPLDPPADISFECLFVGVYKAGGDKRDPLKNIFPISFDHFNILQQKAPYQFILRQADIKVVERLCTSQEGSVTVLVVAGNAKDDDSRLERARQLAIPIVLTEWVAECVITNQIVDVNRYPSCLFEPLSQKSEKKKPKKKKI